MTIRNLPTTTPGDPMPVRTHRSAATRRRWLASSLLVSTLVLASCGEPPTSGGGGGGREGASEEEGSKLPECPLEALEAATAPVNVNMWFGGIVDPPATVLTDLIKEFNASQDKVVVKADNQGSAYKEVLDKYEGASGKPDQLPDMIYLEDTTLGEMVDKGQVLPAQACMEADGFDITELTPAARASYSVDGVLYPGYMNVSAPVIYYNKVHFEKAGLDPNKPPTTLAEVGEFARILKEKGVSKKPFAFLANEWFLNTWITGIGQDAVNNGNGRTKEATEATFDSPEVVSALQTLKDYNAEGLLNPFAVVDGGINHYLSLLSEDSSMLIETSTASGTIAQVLGGDLTAEEAGIDFDASTVDVSKIVPGSGQLPGLEGPGQIYASGGAFFILNTGTPAEQAASWKFYKFMLQPENVKKWHIEGGYLPMLKSVVRDPDVIEYQNTDLAGLLLKPAVEQLATADPDRPGPLIGPYIPYQDAIRGALEGVLFNDADPAGALATAQTDVTALLKDYSGT